MKKALLLMLTLLTLGFAAQRVSAQTVWDGTADISWYDATQTSFDISTPEQLAGVAALMTAQTTNFSGVTLNLTGDIWLNADNDSTNNWIPIGGYATASGEDSYSYSSYSFAGNFKGNGHYIYNMYCEKSSYFQAGLFGCVQYPCTIDSLILVNSVVKANGMSGSLIGYTLNSGNVYVSNCLIINGRVEATNGNNNGGILGGNWKMQDGSNWTFLTNCAFTGHVHGKYLGGLVGNGQKIDATNVYFAGTMDPVMADNLAYGGLLGHSSAGKFNLTNAYSNITSTYSSGRDGTVMTESEMLASSFVTTLGDAFMADNGMNNGYPILSCMAGISASATEICQGESVTLTGVGYDTYSWTPGGQTTQSITVTPTTTTTYTMTGTTSAGVTGTHSVTITVYPQAVITATVATSPDGQVHATVTPETATVGCGSSDNVTFTVTPDEHWRVASVYVNGTLQEGEQTYGTFVFTVNPGGTLANVVINMTDALTCTNVLNLEASDIYGSNATVSWNAHTTGELSEYHIIVRDVVAETEMEYTTTELSYVIMGLNESTQYQIGVYTFCLDGYGSDTAYVSFTTPCNNPVNYSVGNATTTNNYLPTQIYYGNSYTQQIVTADVFEGTPNDFASISVKDNSSNETTRACDIYLAHVPASMNLANDWILPSNSTVTFSLVFSGNVQFGTADWVKIDFDTVFPYNGTDNVLVVFNDHTNSYTSTHSYDVVENTNTSSMSRYIYRDGTPFDPFNPGTQSYNAGVLNVVNTFRFSYCSESSCISPNTLSASNVTSSSADIAWVAVGSEPSWEVEYKAEADTEWTSAGSFYTAEASLMGLEPNTVYTVRVRALCGGNEESPWSESISFRTQCDALTTLPYSTSFEDATGDYVYCWSRLASDASHMVYRYGSSTYSHTGGNCLDFAYTPNNWTIAIMPAFDATIPANSLMLDFWLDKTGNSGSFEVGVMTDPEDATTFEVVDTVVSTLVGNSADYYEHIILSLENYSGNGQYIAFRVSNGESCGYRMDDLYVTEIPNCIYPTNFHATNVGNDEVTLAWTETGTATQWNIIYDLTGFDPEMGGTTVAADANPYTVTGLQNVTTYDFYVQADCGGMTSDWVGPLTIKTGVYNMGVTGSDTLTTCGMYIYDDGGADGNHSTSCDYTLVIYPETAGSGLSLSGSVNLYNASSYYQGTLTVYEGVGTSGNVLGTFTGTQTVNVAYGGPVTLRLTTGSYSYYNYAGFEILVQCTECFPPSNVAVSGQTLDGATVTWSGSSDSYEVVLGGAMSQTYTTMDTSYTFTGLSSSSSYTVKVRGICGTDTSLYSSTASFNTSCGAITVTADNPWFEDFEGYAGGGEHQFVCWETPVTTPGGGPFVYCGYAQSAHSGANTAEMKGYTNMVVLPEFTNDIHDLRLTFWATYYGSGTSAVVGVITDVSDTSTFEVLGDAGTPGPRGSQSGVSGNGNFMGPFDFNSVQATSGRIAILFTGSGTSSGWNLDDFTVSLSPNCPSPVKTSVQATNVDGHNATITFVDNDPDHNSWTVYYKPSADSVWIPEVTNTTSMTLTNLDPQTQYDVYVVTNCTTPDIVEDATNTIHFTTTVACPAPQDVTVSNIGMTSATVTWFSNADSFTIEYGEAGFTVGTGTTATVTTNSYDLTGLTAGTAYTVYVTADCGIDGSSTSASANFSTSLCEVSDQCQFTFNLEDSFGDGWNGASITVQQNGATVATVTFTSYSSSSTQTVTLCDNQSTTLIWNSGSYDSECSFEVVSPNQEVIYTSSSLSAGTLTTFTTSCTPPTCPRPASIAAANIGATTAEISWVSTGTETAWNVEYKTTADATWTVVPVTTNPYTLTNLTASTDYDVRVQADCGGGDVSDYRETSFTTAGCELADQCAFTFTLTDAYGDGWNGGTLDVEQNGVVVTTLGLSSGNTATEIVNLCDNATVSLVWNAGSYAYEAGFSLAGPDGTVIYTHDSMSTYSTYTFTVDCSGSGPGPVVTDPTVSTQAASAIGQNTATLNATITNPDNVTITAKGFEWMPLMGTDYTQVVGTGTGNTFTANLSNLDPNTDYIFKAFITYNGTTVYGNDLIFTTLPEDTPEPCDVPTGLDTTNVANEVISITWDANANVNSWNVQYRVQNGQWTSSVANTNGYTITGLTGNTTYEIQVQANCGDGNLSDWCASLFVTTKSVGIESWLENSVNLYPNPAREYVDIRVDGDVNVTSMEVYDVYGKLINTVTVVENPTRINVSNLADGMYFVRVTTEMGAVTKTFVKK